MNTVFCSKCGNENLCTNIRCEKCGEQLITEEQAQDMHFDPLLNEQQNTIRVTQKMSFIQVFTGIITTIVGSLFSFVSIVMVLSGDNITRIIGIPFLICGIAVLLYGFLLIIKGTSTKKNVDNHLYGNLDMEKVEKSEETFYKATNLAKYIYTFGFLLLWFGFLIAFDITAIKSWSDGGYIMFLFSLIFWIAGFSTLINTIKKKDK